MQRHSTKVTTASIYWHLVLNWTWHNLSVELKSCAFAHLNKQLCDNSSRFMLFGNTLSAFAAILRKASHGLGRYGDTAYARKTGRATYSPMHVKVTLASALVRIFDTHQICMNSKCMLLVMSFFRVRRFVLPANQTRGSIAPHLAM